MGASLTDTRVEAERLEHHLCREFVVAYMQGKRAISPNKVFMAARFSGLKISTRTLEKVLGELTRQRKARVNGWHRPGLQSTQGLITMTTEVYPENRELGFALTLIKHMDLHNLLLAERAVREAISKLTQQKQIEEFDHRRRVGTM